MKLATLAFAALALPAAALADPADVLGVWQVESGTAHIEIADCGDATPCGKIVWADAPEGQLNDTHPDPELAAQPLIGSQMLWGFKASKKGWKSGKIFNGENGKTYGSRMKRIDDDTLQVKGCVGPICQTQTWTRVTG